MPVIIQSPFNSAVVEANLDIFTRSYTEEESVPSVSVHEIIIPG
ncbi:hypothetical protein [uncultured Desulfobacter sp.]|nr:hypothetical protein [uncultured Desulfobacter sp.]